jgi:hypothetical protein
VTNIINDICIYYLRKLEIDVSKIQDINFAIFTQLQFHYNNKIQNETVIIYTIGKKFCNFDYNNGIIVFSLNKSDLILHKDEILKILKIIYKLNIYVSISLDDQEIDLEYFIYFFEYILSLSNLSFDIPENPIERDRILNSINKYIEKLSTCYSLARYQINDLETVVILEDSVVLYFGVCYRYNNHGQLQRSYISSVQELTYNVLTKANVFQIRKEYALTYYRFIGAKEINNEFKYFDEAMQFERVNNLLPELKLKERYDAWQGILYHFVVFELEDYNNVKKRAIGYTTDKIHNFVLKVCKALEIRNWNSLKANGSNGLIYSLSKDFIEALLSWKEKSRKWRLENKLSYFYMDGYIKEKSRIYLKAAEIYEAVQKGEYADIERGFYTKPINRWKTEEFVFLLTKKICKNYTVIYQHRPFFLKSANGQLSYDVFITGLNIAIEYQGKQHFEAVEYFGGKENFLQQIYRDKLKEKLSIENGVKLVYINYWEDVTIDLIKERIGLKN